MFESNEQSGGNPAWGYKLNFSPAPSEATHDFCGQPSIEGGTCPNCNKPLLRLLSLFSRDRVLNFDDVRHPVVHLLYCWTCSIPYGKFSYQINVDGSIQVLEVPDRSDYEFGAEGPYEGYTGVFPYRQVSLQPLSDKQQNELEARRKQDAPKNLNPYFGHQVGGYPLIYNPSKSFCPKCSMEMPLLASICDSAAGNDESGDDPSKSFTGNCGVQMVFQFCRNCSVITAYHSCD